MLLKSWLFKEDAINPKPQEKEMLSSCIFSKQPHSATAPTDERARDSWEMERAGRKEKRRVLNRHV